MAQYSLFLADDGQLFGYGEAEESLEKSLEGMDTEEINIKWQAEFAPSSSMLLQDAQVRPF